MNQSNKISFSISGVLMVLWDKGVNSRILTGPISVSCTLFNSLCLLTVPALSIQWAAQAGGRRLPELGGQRGLQRDGRGADHHPGHRPGGPGLHQEEVPGQDEENRGDQVRQRKQKLINTSFYF